jgi:hypothetical protein
MQSIKEPKMQTTDFAKQTTGAMAHPKQIGQWLKGAWPTALEGNSVAAPAKAWIGSIEPMLQGAEELRQMQLDAIHRTKKRTSQLAKALTEARSPADTTAALQAFAQDNLQESIQYWSAYRGIVQDAELHMLGEVAPAADGHARKALAKGRTPVARHTRVASSRKKSSAVA